MNNFQEIYEQYKSALRLDLNKLEKERKISVAKIFLVVAFILALTVICVIHFRGIAPFFVILSLILAVIFVDFLSRSYRREFRKTIIVKIIGYIDSSLKYLPNEYISLNVFKESYIFADRFSPNRYKGKDYVSGKIKGVSLRFSILDVEYDSPRTTSAGEHILSGLFFVIDSPKKIDNFIMVSPRSSKSRLFKTFTPKRKPPKIWGELVAMENPEFDSHFEVYSTKPDEARSLLSSAVVWRINEYNKNTKHDIYISFSGQKIYVALDMANTFDPPIFKPVINFERGINDFFNILGFVIGLNQDIKSLA